MKLLPCPLCGNDEIDLSPALYEGEALFVIRCDFCGVTLAPESREVASLIWNQRAPRPAAAAGPYEVREHPVVGRFQIIKQEVK